jgi:hypothetical protein
MVNAHFESIFVEQFLAKLNQTVVVDLYFSAARQADQMVMRLAHQLVHDSGPSYVRLRNEAQVLQPLQNAVYGRIGQVLFRAFSLDVALNVADGEVVIALAQRFDDQAALDRDALPFRFDLIED